MRRLDGILVLFLLNIVAISATSETQANAAKVANNANEGTKTVAEGLVLKTQAPVVVGKQQNLTAAINNTHSVQLQKEIPTLNGNKSVISGATKNESAVKIEAKKKPVEIVKPEERSKEVPKTLPSINVEETQKPTTDKTALPSESEVQYQKVLNSIDYDIENSVRTGFYILMGISVGALLFVGFKLNKMRLSRAERKYGVQGNRSNQELAPLPLSMEDPDSDDEDQTLFDANRHQIRIF